MLGVELQPPRPRLITVDTTVSAWKGASGSSNVSNSMVSAIVRPTRTRCPAPSTMYRRGAILLRLGHVLYHLLS